ncbi:oxidoreductase [Bacillus sp. FJAT-18017]|uniref:molybdopterin-dependent oxidoreductase n=1 Tax=Bacillus sp. FJAT-18017 TaxID=1705566 RepID=UPI0006AF9E9E|nr:molybdopterin-dependent oxidoreductase [Bacillus sp. FJAT-18017]ALC88526.1 oxidoreductase [Bacillus sp. FJAT-18017]
MLTVHKSACPLNCWDSCGFQVKIENGKVVQIDGDPDHPITKGKICGRGRTLTKRINAEDRLLYPLKKVNGQFTRISWEAALNEIAAKMKEIKGMYGPSAVLHTHDYANNGIMKNLDQRFFNAYGGATELVGSLCWGAGIEAQKWDFGDALSHEPGDLLHSKHIVVWGRNAARTNLHFYQDLLEAKKKGSKIYVIDPVYNATAKMANEYISVKPGMDGLLAAGILKEMLRLGLEDRNFINEHTAGFLDIEEILSGITLEKISEMVEVPVERITWLATIYADKPVSTYMGLGMQRYKNGGNTIRWIDALVAASGNIGIRGGGANYANLQVGQSFQAGRLSLAERKEESRQFPIMKQAEFILKAQNPPIKMIINTCGNPVIQVPDSTTVEKAFSQVETVVVIEHFMTETALLADYVLPAASVFEEEDSYYASMYHHYVNYAPKLIDPPGEAKSDSWIWTELAKRLGFGSDFTYTTEQWLEMYLEPVNKNGLTLTALREKNFFELPVEKVPWMDRNFKTPSGKYEFTSTVADNKGLSGRLELSYPVESKWNNEELAMKFPYSLLTIHPLRSNHSQHYHILEPAPKLVIEVAANIAEKHGLIQGCRARVWNNRGEVHGIVSIMPKAHMNTIVIDEGIWKKFGGSVNKLTSSSASDNGQGSTLYDCLVAIEKID